ncbi:MAG: ammonia-forming cytochrome c nitrite reductase subunit c552 [Candidatus Marinimicrobia bacterium]|nr:ammonia-forming cytochrome c nitrite reductase subunit c552 [Candidatus Neomarinimicrobiota bacterium]
MKNKYFLLIIIFVLAFSSFSKKEEISYMGSRSCIDCHERFYDLWESSYHGRAMMDFSEDFSKDHLSDCENFISVGSDAFQFKLKGKKGFMVQRSTMRSYPIRHVLGGKYVYYFLTPLEKGKLQTLPLGYDVKKKQWFDITASSIRFHQDMPDEALPWTDRRYTFNTACFSCHVSQLSTDYDITSDTYHTTWMEPGINCETCHGPAEEHNRIFTNAQKNGTTPDSIYLKTYTQSRGFSPEIVNATCAYCHAKSISLTAEYIVGEDFFQHYDLVGPEHPDFYPDGRDLGENYTYSSWLMSPCVRNSDMDCLHCHTSSGRYKQKDDPNTSCLPCHADRVAHATDHTKHQPTSSGNVCINCHMPKTTFARMTRSDHSMRPPVPAATRAYGSPNACNDCHTTKSPEWAESFILEHFSGKFQKETLMWADYLDQLRRGETDNLNNILPDMIRPIDEVTLSALIRSLHNVHDERIITLMYFFMGHDSPLVRASAATIMGDYDASIALDALFNATNDPVRLVRIRAAAELLEIPVNEIPEVYHRSVLSAIDEYKNSLTAYPDQEISQFNLGHFHEMQENYEAAARDYRRALALRPEFMEASVNLGMLYYQSGQLDSAKFYLTKAAQQTPGHAGAGLNLGLLYAELGEFDKAIVALSASFDLQKTAVAANNLAILFSKSSPLKALEYAKEAYLIETNDPKYVYNYAFYLMDNAKSDEAAGILEKAIRDNVVSFDIYYLLGSLYKNSGKEDAYRGLMKKANKDKSLSENERSYFKLN